MKARVLFWSVILLLQFLSLRFVSAVEMRPEYYAGLGKGWGGASATSSAPKDLGPVLCSAFLPDLIKEIKSESPKVAKALQTLYGAAVRMSDGRKAGKMKPIEITPEIKKAYEIIANWFRQANLPELEKYLEAGRAELLGDLREMEAQIDTAEQAKNRIPTQIAEQNSKIAPVEEELKIWTRFNVEWTRAQVAQEGDAENAAANRALAALNDLLDKHGSDNAISDDTKTALRGAIGSSTVLSEQVIALTSVIENTILRLSTAKSQSDIVIAQLTQSQTAIGENAQALRADYKRILDQSAEELLLVALEELRIRKGYEDIQEDIRLKQEAEELRRQRAQEAHERQVRTAAEKTERARELRQAQTEELFAFLDKTLEGRKFPSQGLAAIDTFRGAAYLGDENVAESAADLNFSLAIFSLVTAAQKKGFQNDLIAQIFPIWVYGGAPNTRGMKELEALTKKVGANRSFAFISKRVLSFSDKTANIWAGVVKFAMTLRSEKAPVNMVGGANTSSLIVKPKLSKAQTNLLKDVYLDLQKFQRNKLKMTDRTAAAASLADWMMVTGNALVQTSFGNAQDTIWSATETGLRNRTRRTVSFTWKWFVRPAIIASLVIAGGTAAVTEGLNYAHSHGVPYIHDRPIESLPTRAQSWAAIDEASNWADKNYGMEWQRVAANQSGVYYTQSMNWIESVVNPTAVPVPQNGTRTATPAATPEGVESTPSVPESILP